MPRDEVKTRQQASTNGFDSVLSSSFADQGKGPYVVLLHVFPSMGGKTNRQLKVGDPTLVVLADYFPLGSSAGECYEVSSQPGKWSTCNQVAEWSNSLTKPTYVQRLYRNTHSMV